MSVPSAHTTCFQAPKKKNRDNGRVWGLTRGTALEGYLGLRVWVRVLGLFYLFAIPVRIPATSQVGHDARTADRVLSSLEPQRQT